MSASPVPRSPTYSHTVRVQASTEQVMKAFTTLCGVRSWWSPVVAGSLDPGGEFHVGFAGLDETITLFVLSRHDASVDWSVRRHTSAPAWDGSRISLSVVRKARGSLLTVEHDGVPPEMVAPGWEHFLGSIGAWVERGVGRPYPWDREGALAVALQYHGSWTAGRYEEAMALVADDLATEVPINSYASRAEWAAALRRFGGMVDRVEMVAELGGAAEALLLYDMHSSSFGVLRIAEHFTVTDGLITRIRHVHDTQPLR